MIRKVLIPALALAGLTTTPAIAQEQIWIAGDGFTINARDLDLGTSSGRAALLSRLDSAVREVCQPVAPRVSRQACEARMKHRAMAGSSAGIGRAIRMARVEQDAPRLAAR